MENLNLRTWVRTPRAKKWFCCRYREHFERDRVTPRLELEYKEIKDQDLKGNMATHLKLPTFNGMGDEDMDRFWFVTESVWMAQNVTSDVVKQAQLSLAFEERALDWYMGYIGQNLNAIINEIKVALK